MNWTARRAHRIPRACAAPPQVRATRFSPRDRPPVGFRQAGISVPQGRVKIAQCFSTGFAGRSGESRSGRQKPSSPILSSPPGLAPLRMADPALKCWAIFVCPCGTGAERQVPVQETEMSSLQDAVQESEMRPHQTEDQRSSDLVSELMILPDGRVLVHNLTPTFAALLSELNPNCEQIASRTTNHSPRPDGLPN